MALGPALNSSDRELVSASRITREHLIGVRGWLEVYGRDLTGLYAAEEADRDQITVAYLSGLIAARVWYVWVRDAGRYYDIREGRLLRNAEVRYRLDLAIQRAGIDARTHTLAMRERTSLVEWELGMRERIRPVAIVSVALASGGEAALTATLPAIPMPPVPPAVPPTAPTEEEAPSSPIEQIQDHLEEQFEFLRNFGRQIESGEQPVDGRAASRARMYIESGRGAYERAVWQLARELGYDEMRNRRWATDSCATCLAMTRLQWIPIDSPDWVPIGYRICLNHCKCTVQFRRSATGEQMDGEEVGELVEAGAD